MTLHDHAFPDYPKAVNLARRLGSRQPEDDAQNAYVRILARGYNGRYPPGAWFWIVLRSVVFDGLRRARYRQAEPLDTDPPDPASRDPLAVLEVKETVARVMARCNGSGRIVALLAEGWTYKEIAGATGRLINTIKSRINRAREACRKMEAK